MFLVQINSLSIKWQLLAIISSHFEYKMKISYRTPSGIFYNSKIENALESKKLLKHQGNVNLIFTSPPFPLNRKKKYGNLQGEEYIQWLAALAPKLSQLLSVDGSIVIEVGNSWEPGLPVMSTLALRSLLKFMELGELNLCQQFIWNNPAKLPSPAQWVNVDRCRVKDSFTHLWWFSKTPYPKANNKNILVEYSKAMEKLIASKEYNSGRRPSEHKIGKYSFTKDNSGAIPSSVLTVSNTNSNDQYHKYCRLHDIKIHPARMPSGLAEFFIKFLTSEDDLVLDPFGGSNTTGAAAEKLARKWLSFEPNEDYIRGSLGRFNKITYKNMN